MRRRGSTHPPAASPWRIDRVTLALPARDAALHTCRDPLMPCTEHARRSPALRRRRREGLSALVLQWLLPTTRDLGAGAGWIPKSLEGRAFHVATDDPMMASVAGRYAAALFDLANEQRQLQQIEQDLSNLQNMLDSSKDFQRLVRSPVFSAEEQARALSAIAEKARLSPLTVNFLRLIARNRRQFALADMIKNFRSLAARHRGEVTADVTSAHPLTESQLETLRETLRVSVAGKSVQLHTRVDPNLLGGLVVKIGSRMIDSSLRTKLSNLKIAMKGTG